MQRNLIIISAKDRTHTDEREKQRNKTPLGQYLPATKGKKYLFFDFPETFGVGPPLSSLPREENRGRVQSYQSWSHFLVSSNCGALDFLDRYLRRIHHTSAPMRSVVFWTRRAINNVKQDFRSSKNTTAILLLTPCYRPASVLWRTSTGNAFVPQREKR